MCLAVPALITEILDSDRAIASLGGVSKEISIALVDDLVEGDYVVLHTGFAINKLDTAEALKTLRMFEELGMAGRDD